MKSLTYLYVSDLLTLRKKKKKQENFNANKRGA